MRSTIVSKEINIPLGNDAVLTGILTVPKEAIGIVLFVHGSGSSRLSPRNQFVARDLNEGGLATLLIDLLTPAEEEVDQYTREFRFNIALLAERLKIVTEWLIHHPETKGLDIGYFGSSTGAAAALIAAASEGSKIGAVVSRGGRPDLAASALKSVQAPTLLIVGGEDTLVIELNQHAFDMMSAEKRLEIIPGATHLFEEPGTLAEAARLARLWFIQHL